MTRTCKYEPCGQKFEPTDARQEFCGGTCRANHHYAGHPEKGRPVPSTPLQSVATHPLAEARAEQEASELKSHWSQVIYQGIVSRLEHGPVHADDLEALFPANDEERAMCRKLVGAQFGSLASRHYIKEVDRRKSSVPSRKGAKSGVFEFTRKGRGKLAGHRAGCRGESSLVRSRTAHATSSSVSGDSSHTPAGAARSSAGVPEPLTLLPEPGNYQDPDQRRAA